MGPFSALSPVPLRAPSMLKALEGVLSPTGFPYGSNGPLFKDGQFGRDSLETSEDLLEARPDIARAVILRLAALQGTTLDARTAEEPGKIHHEYRALVMDGRPITGESARIFRQLARAWHLAETDEEFASLTQLTNYCTVDATPLYVRLIAKYCARYGREILDETYISRNVPGSIDRSTIRDSVHAAIEWTAGAVEGSDIGLLEWRRQMPWSHLFQAWKDGGTSYLHEDGSFGNYTAPMAALEVQGLAYDALVAAGALLSDLPVQVRRRYADRAEALRKATIERFWMPDREYFAMALDRNRRTGEVRQLRVLTSNAGALLDTGIFDTFSPAEYERYVVSVVQRLFSDEFLAPVGIRCTSLAYKDLLDYHAYQSSYTIWHKETYDIAKGLRRQDLPRLARELEHRLLNAINLAGPREFIYCLPDGRCDFKPASDARLGEIVEIWGTNVPENDQAWTVAAALAIKKRQGLSERPHPVQFPPHDALENEVLRRITEVRLLRTLTEIEDARPSDYSIHVDTAKGRECERSWVQHHDLETT